MFSTAAFAQSWKTQPFDIRWQSITDAEMTKAVETESNDAVALYRLWWAAIYQQKQEAFFSQLRKLKDSDPKNGVVLTVYCAVLEDCLHYGDMGKYQFSRTEKEKDPDYLISELEKAQKLEPQLWMVYTTNADLVLLTKGPASVAAQEAVKLCRKAVTLAPDISYVHQKLGYALCAEAMSNKTAYTEAISEYEKASVQYPKDAGTGFLLRNAYKFYEPSEEKAGGAANYVLGTIPPGTELPLRLKKMLERQGIMVRG